MSARPFLHSGDRADRPGALFALGRLPVAAHGPARLASHAGFYAPVAAVICPCKGNEPGLEENLTALDKLRISELRNLFLAGHEPRSRAEGHRASEGREPASGAYRDCGAAGGLRRKSVQPAPRGGIAAGKCRRACLHRFGRALAARLAAETGRAAAGSAHRRDHRLIAGSFRAAQWARAALRARWPRPGTPSVATLLGRAGENFCWGGGTAIRRQDV